MYNTIGLCEVEAREWRSSVVYSNARVLVFLSTQLPPTVFKSEIEASACIRCAELRISRRRRRTAIRVEFESAQFVTNGV